MREMGLAGVIRGKPVRTTISDKAAPCPLDHVNRRFYAPAPNMLWVSDFTYVATWTGFVYVAFVIDTYTRRIVGWRASRKAHASFVFDALEQALHDRRPAHRGGPWRHFEAVEYATLKWVDWFNHRLLEPIGNIPPPKPKINMMLPQTNSIWQPDSQPKASGKPGAVQIAGGGARLTCGYAQI
jgi:putative transposase